MAHTQTVSYPCLICNHKLTAQIYVKATVGRESDAHVIRVEDIPPIQCPKCKTYSQVEVSNLYLDFQVNQLKTM